MICRLFFSGCFSLSAGSLGSFDNSIETCGVVDGDLTEHFSIQGNVRLFAAINELAVPKSSLAACRAYTNDPETSEIALAEFSANAGIHCGTNSCFFSES
jgi:hypothetical protein